MSAGYHAMGLVGNDDTPLQAVFSVDESCTPDIDNDGMINTHDLLAVIGAWGECGADCPADLNGDGEVAIDDLLLIIGLWGDCP